MADLRASLVLADNIADGVAGAPNNSPTVCVLADGTVLAASAVRGAGVGKEVVQVWHVDGSGTLLGQYTYVNDGWSGKDPALVALDGTNALLIATCGQYAGDPDPDTTFVISLDCSGNNPVPTATTQSPFMHEFGNVYGSRFSYYIPSTGQAVVNGKNGIAVYKNGAFESSYAVSNNVYGWWRHPTDSTKLAVQYYSSGYKSIEYTITPGAITATPRPDWVYSEEYWLFALGSPYDASAVRLEAGDQPTGPDGWQLLRPDNTVAATYPPPSDKHYENVSGIMNPVADQNYVAVYEYDVSDPAATPRDTFVVGVADIDYSTDPPTRAETLLNWGTTAPSVSVSWGSWTADSRNGTLALVGTSTNAATHGDYSVTLWLLDVQGTTPVPAALGLFAVEIAPGVYRPVGAAAPVASTGRLKVRSATGWWQEWFASDGALERWPLKILTPDGWKVVAWMTAVSN